MNSYSKCHGKKSGWGENGVREWREGYNFMGVQRSVLWDMKAELKELNAVGI